LNNFFDFLFLQSERAAGLPSQNHEMELDSGVRGHPYDLASGFFELSSEGGEMVQKLV